MPPRKTKFFATLILGNKKQTSPKKYRKIIFIILLGHMQKISHFWAKMKKDPKCQLGRFCPEPFNCLAQLLIILRQQAGKHELQVWYGINETEQQGLPERWLNTYLQALSLLCSLYTWQMTWFCWFVRKDCRDRVWFELSFFDLIPSTEVPLDTIHRSRNARNVLNKRENLSVKLLL